MIPARIEARGQAELGYCDVCGAPREDTIRLAMHGWAYEGRACAGCLRSLAARADGNGAQATDGKGD